MDTPTKQSLERAMAHVSQLWFPANPEHLTTVKTKLRRGLYEGNKNRLQFDLKSDLSLFLFFMRQLATLIETRRGLEEQFLVDQDPLSAAVNLENTALSAILEVESWAISPHKFEGASTLQGKRVNEMLTSAGTVETLAQAEGLDNNLAYTSAICRQIGFALIAWNYPSIYERSVKALNDNTSLEILITEQLGFSPYLLAYKLVHSWGSYPSIGEILHTPDALEEHDALQPSREPEKDKLLQLISVGESLARATCPEVYPSAADDWEVASAEITRILGTDGVKEITQRVTQYSKHYLESKLGSYAGIGLPTLQPQSTDTIGYSNPHITNCSSELKEMLANLYQKLSPNKVSLDNLKYLLNEVTPSAGFSAMIVYTYDPALDALVVQATTGVGINEHKKIVPCKSNLLPDRLLSQTLLTGGLSHLSRLGDNLVPYYSIIAPISTNDKIGVVLAELPEDRFIENVELYKHHCLALSVSLRDCLSLR